MHRTAFSDIDRQKQQPLSTGRKLRELVARWLSITLIVLPLHVWHDFGPLAAAAAVAALFLIRVIWVALRHRLTHR